MRVVALLVALSTTACFYGPRHKPAKYVASAAMIGLGAALMFASHYGRDCHDEETIGASIGCSVGKGAGKVLGGVSIGMGVIVLGATLASPDPAPEPPPAPLPQPLPRY